MKIGILTTPLHNNYGGLLQAYALQSQLKRMRHDVWILQREQKGALLKLMRFCRRLLYLLKGKYCVTEKDRKMLSVNMNYFRDKYICPKSPYLFSTQQMSNYIDAQHFNAVIVGSDQVWRPTYTPFITNYFLDFVRQEDVKRISYAASFGVDTWEFSAEDTERCKSLIKRFKTVSVREESAIMLCRDQFQLEACQVLDPTFFFEKEFYEELITQENEKGVEGDMFFYILDKTEEKQRVIDLIADLLDYKTYDCMPAYMNYADMTKENREEFKYPPVTQWLRSIRDAKMVLTDSFHGCVFSIIFNKPFWVIPNASRGTARFVSLLKIFGLGSRILDAGNISHIDWLCPIDWKKVNEIKETWKVKSLQFLQDSLS